MGELFTILNDIIWQKGLTQKFCHTPCLITCNHSLIKAKNSMVCILKCSKSRKTVALTLSGIFCNLHTAIWQLLLKHLSRMNNSYLICTMTMSLTHGNHLQAVSILWCAESYFHLAIVLENTTATVTAVTRIRVTVNITICLATLTMFKLCFVMRIPLLILFIVQLTG